MTLKSGAEPYEIGILLVCLIWGIAALVGLTSGSSTRELPDWGVHLFFATLATGSALALAGVALERVFLELSGFYLERAGQCALVGLSISYTVWTVSTFGARAISFALFLAVIWVCGAIRIWEITRDLRDAAKEPSP